MLLRLSHCQSIIKTSQTRFDVREGMNILLGQVLPVGHFLGVSGLSGRHVPDRLCHLSTPESATQPDCRNGADSPCSALTFGQGILFAFPGIAIPAVPLSTITRITWFLPPSNPSAKGNIAATRDSRAEHKSPSSYAEPIPSDNASHFSAGPSSSPTNSTVSRSHP